MTGHEILLVSDRWYSGLRGGSIRARLNFAPNPRESAFGEPRIFNPELFCCKLETHPGGFTE